MTWSTEDLMAYADGELDAGHRSRLEAEMLRDPALREQAEALATQRRRVAAAFAELPDDPVPDRLSALLGVGEAQRSRVVDFTAERAKRAGARDRMRALPGWAQWGGMAASVALGIMVGQLLTHHGADEALVVEHGGAPVAGPAIARALDDRLASDGGPVQVQLSFLDRDGRYCRTFSAPRLAGLACRQGASWTVVATAQPAPSPPREALRPASAQLPRAVLDAVDARIAGTTLDAAQEIAARDRGWVR